jgi:hypothetical protein
VSEVNEVYAAERDEWRSALHDMTEVERARDCSHEWAPDRRHGVLVCRHCGDTEEP